MGPYYLVDQKVARNIGRRGGQGCRILGRIKTRQNVCLNKETSLVLTIQYKNKD